MTKTSQHFKQYQPTPIVSALFLENNVRIISHYKVHMRPKTAEPLKPCFCLQTLMGFATFFNGCVSVMKIVAG